MLIFPVPKRKNSHRLSRKFSFSSLCLWKYDDCFSEINIDRWAIEEGAD